MQTDPSKPPWWQTTTVYQIYPRSFMDSNNDGVGDLPGIISRLDYVKDLGFETLWISPFYRSPQADFGYDVSDYQSIAPEYGTMDDAQNLIDEVHRREMRVVFDMIFCHTSIEHPWFTESRSGRDNPYSDWYIWRDGRQALRGPTGYCGISDRPKKKGLRQLPPTNWKSITGVNGWQYEPRRNQWFYTNFLSFQPDLNYRHPPVKEAMLDNVRFWLDRGVDGFRLDIFHAVFKDNQFRDNPFSFRIGQPADSNDGANQIKKYTMNLPENITFARELRRFTDQWSPQRLLLGEVFGRHQVIRQYLGTPEKPGIHAIFLFQMIRFTFSARFFRAILQTFEQHYPQPALPTLVLGNHDQRRWISKVGAKTDGTTKTDRAKCISLLQLTARGIPVIYYGEEIGMEDGDFPFRGALDPVARQYSWLPRWVAGLLKLYLNRDGCRTPMQWTPDQNGGFTTADPWLPVHPNHTTVNVARQQAAPDSLLNHYRTLLRLRRAQPALNSGSQHLLTPPAVPGSVVAYTRNTPTTDNENPGFSEILIAINFGRKTHTFANPTTCRTHIYTTSPDTQTTDNQIVLPPATAVILGRDTTGAPA